MNLLGDSHRFADTVLDAAVEVSVPAACPVVARTPAGLEEGSPGHQALVMHTRFLQEVLAEVLVVLSQGQASVERLSRALTCYWDASLARRHTRLEVLRLAEGSSFEQSVEQMGRPFIYMVVSELWPKYGASATALAGDLYWEARSLSLDEAFAGQPDLVRRNALLSQL